MANFKPKSERGLRRNQTDEHLNLGPSVFRLKYKLQNINFYGFHHSVVFFYGSTNRLITQNIVFLFIMLLFCGLFFIKATVFVLTLMDLECLEQCLVQSRCSLYILVE